MYVYNSIMFIDMNSLSLLRIDKSLETTQSAELEIC